ncbi:MAG TPA: hypothetical protein VJ161_06805 [Geobacteraceae bacterium]|nr:hypothetical protein [Geobacteraceae bacterium]
MKLVTGIITAALFLGAGNHALASIAEPASPVEIQSAGNAIHPTSESTTNNSVSISGTTDMGTPDIPPVLITGNVTPSSTLADMVRGLRRGHGGFFFDNAESPTARISISRVSPAATSISVMNAEPSSDGVQPSATPVPLPPAFLLAASGLAGLIAARRKMLPA